jgi:hypothetical protein
MCLCLATLHKRHSLPYIGQDSSVIDLSFDTRAIFCNTSVELQNVVRAKHLLNPQYCSALVFPNLNQVLPLQRGCEFGSSTGYKNSSFDHVG